MDIIPTIVEKHFEEIEKIAEEILSDQQEIISLDKRRNLNREALRQMKTNPKCQESNHNWACVGNMFMRLPRDTIIRNVQKEQDQLDLEIENLRNGLRNKVNQLNELEGKPLTRGSGLKALSKEEWKAVNQVLGR